MHFHSNSLFSLLHDQVSTEPLEDHRVSRGVATLQTQTDELSPKRRPASSGLLRGVPEPDLQLLIQLVLCAMELSQADHDPV
jgi:hypothetical protein